MLVNYLQFSSSRVYATLKVILQKSSPYYRVSQKKRPLVRYDPFSLMGVYSVTPCIYIMFKITGRPKNYENIWKTSTHFVLAKNLHVYQISQNAAYSIPIFHKVKSTWQMWVCTMAQTTFVMKIFTCCSAFSFLGT